MNGPKCIVRIESVLLPTADIGRRGPQVAMCRFCCKNRLMACADNDSVALTRFAAEAGDDGAAEARAGAAFLRVPARRRGTGRSPGARDRCRARSVLGPR